MSALPSVSALTSDSAVVKITREPSVEAAANSGTKAPLPPSGPVETRAVPPELRS